MPNLISLLGFACFIFIAWCLSNNRRKIIWRPVIGGIILQFFFGILVFTIPASRSFFVFFSNEFTRFINFSQGGIEFIFGSLSNGNAPTGLILATQILPFIIIFAAIVSLLYYIGFMQLIIKFFALIFSKILKTSGAETLCASSTIFVGVESSLTVKPYLEKMTESELFLILTAGMSTIASSVLAVYASFLHKEFPLIAGHLLSASIISIPAAFVICKLMYPEIAKPQTIDIAKAKIKIDEDANNFIEAIMNGSSSGAKMAIGVGVTLMVFIGLLGIFNGYISILGTKVGINLSLENILAVIFYPFAWLMGVSNSETWNVANLLGTRFIATEIPAYLNLAKLAGEGMNPRDLIIASYALCGFAHVASMGIFVGGIAALIPQRISLLTKIAPKALLAATMITMMTGCIAGIFYWGQKGLLI